LKIWQNAIADNYPIFDITKFGSNLARQLSIIWGNKEEQKNVKVSLPWGMQRANLNEI
jgi:hypothetical protein